MSQLADVLQEYYGMNKKYYLEHPLPSAFARSAAGESIVAVVFKDWVQSASEPLLYPVSESGREYHIFFISQKERHTAATLHPRWASVFLYCDRGLNKDQRLPRARLERRHGLTI